jgi:hypothetical protein
MAFEITFITAVTQPQFLKTRNTLLQSSFNLLTFYPVILWGTIPQEVLP